MRDESGDDAFRNVYTTQKMTCTFTESRPAKTNAALI
jgi:hypothetical protein